ncbi:MAG: hypothetical protein OD918_09090, partial [Gammaproteobacteria bacterium]
MLYEILALRDGASNADLALSGAPAPVPGAPPRLPCQQCAELFGAPLAAGSVTIAAGMSAAEIALPDIVDDTEREGDEGFMLRLVSLRDANGLPLIEDGARIAAIGAGATAEYTIAANDGFAAPAPASGVRLLATPLLVLHEGLGVGDVAGTTEITESGVISITRPEGLRGRIRGRVTVAGGNDAREPDFTITDQDFHLAPAQYSADVRITALPDARTEMHEEFDIEIRVAEPASGVLPPAVMPKVIILDNDRDVQLDLAAAEFVVEEGDVMEVTVRLRRDGAPAPEHEHPVFFTLTPAFTTATSDDFLGSVAEMEGVVPPGESEATMLFFVAADGAAESEEALNFTLTLTDFADAADDLRNTHDGGITLGAAASASVRIAASTAAVAATNVLRITPLDTTRAYGEAAPGALTYTIAPQDGSAFAAGDNAATTFFTTSPLRLITSPAPANPNAAGAYAFALADTPAYASGIDAKYDFVLPAGARYTITPKEITFTGAGIDKPYDGTAFAPQTAFAGSFAPGDVEEFHQSGMTGVAQTHDDVYVRGGLYAGKDARAAHAIRGFGLGGRQSANYALSAASSARGAITRREVRVAFTMRHISPPDAHAGRFLPQVERVRADGVLADEFAGFRAGLRFSAAFERPPGSPAPRYFGADNAVQFGAWHNVLVNMSGYGCDDGRGGQGDCGMTDSGNFKAANYQLAGNATQVSALVLIGDTPGKPGDVAAARSRDETRAVVSWQPPGDSGAPNADVLINARSGNAIEKYYVRWRSAAAPADARAPGAAISVAGLWQSAAGDSEEGQDAGAVEEYEITGLIAGVAYEAQVRAENFFGADGRGEFSDSVFIYAGPPLVFTSLAPRFGEVSGQAPVHPRQLPANVQLAPGDASIRVTWDAPPGRITDPP